MLLTDDSSDPRQIPTRQNILDAMRWLVRSARTDDSLFFHCMSTFTVSGITVDPYRDLYRLWAWGTDGRP